ncbi:MAG: type II CRISPR RNA-guided endonuclease Cas9 [Candidatus Symbiothrix sp.]|jgi:CRISPR-associated endonuclease Csn1|nr:type II CRISPR RNA-guided endonuclease Cas9 [Candidatus Symbiothrix sp.]
MKKILGLDLGTNSIGWAIVLQNEEEKIAGIEGLGSRIIPMSQDILGNFDAGNSISQTAERTGYRGTRRLRERFLLRRERLHRILNVLGFLPEHYFAQIDFEKRLGQFFEEKEPKISYKEVWNEVKNKTDFIFLFQNSFNEMVEDFKANGQDIKIPYDWTIYYLRKKALFKKIEKEELAWLLLNFNQKRGYYQLRGEEQEENPNKLVEYHSLKIVEVVTDEKPNSKGDIWYSLYLENGWIYRRSSKTPLFDWKDKVRDFIVTTDLNDDGTVKTDKEGNEKRSFRAPSETDWTLLKKKTETEIDKSHKTVGTYIYETLLQNSRQKIRGKLVRTIERKFYKDELIAILKKQIELQPELFTEDMYNDCIRELYRNNEAHQLVLSKQNFVHLFVNDIIFYQRPLRSQKSTIGNCTLEFRKHKDKDRNEIKEYLKAILKSNPLYQEFRLWQWLFNLKIYKKEDDTDVTEQFIKGIEDVENLYDFLMTKKEVNHKDILQYFFAKEGIKGKILNSEIAKYRWNYVFDDSKEKEDDKSKNYPCNETGYEIRRRLAKIENMLVNFLTPEIEQKLWHIIYSVTDKNEFEKALKTFANKYNLDEISFVENYKKFPPFKSEYGAYSEKAIKKLLPLMRLGKYWNFNSIDETTKDRISKIITGEYDETIKTRVREKAINLTNETDFQGLQLWLAQYIVYDRHSEADISGKWNSVADLEKYLEGFKQHSLRNPIVEQVITETLRVVRDIWKKYGDLSEIHIELGREMKNTAEDRQKITNQVSESENTNLRIKALIMELKENSDVENVRPYSPVQQEILKIYEDGVINSNIEIPEDILKISKTAQPSKTELQRYKLWLEQKYCSPYTGQMIPLSKLFTDEYQIEHIIPKSRYFDDSLNNKVICEAAVNQLKDKQLGLEFIKNHHGEKVECGMGKVVEIFSEEAYQIFIKEHYAKNRSKKNNLLLEDIPDKMIARQMNDTRHISKFISALLSNIVREDTNDDGVNSKNIIPCNGKITTILKQDWGLNDVWNDLILPRFERMNTLTNSNGFTAWNEQYQKFLPTVPLELSKGFQKKRIDHRHHAMDALVIACATRDHINLLNNQSAKSDISRYDLQNKLRFKEKQTWVDKKTNKQVEKDVFKEFKKPWDNFTVDARNELGKIVISFKQNLRIINKATNKYEKFKDGKKVEINQEGTNWAIRKPLHKDTVFAKVSLRKIKTVRFNVALKDWKSIVDKELKEEIKRLIALYGQFDEKIVDKYFKDRKYQYKDTDVSKVEIYYFDHVNAATRKNLDTSFNVKAIESITDSGIQKILLNHLATKENNPDLAFSPEGIEEMNQDIVNLNNGKFHQSIYKVRVYEPIGNKFQVGYIGNKKDKYVEAAKGTNLFFAIYVDKDNYRAYETIPLNIVVERLKQGLNAVPEKNEKGHNLLFHLSPNDLVYVPTEDEIVEENININNVKKERIYKMVSSSGNQCFFVQSNVAISIVNKVEFSALNKMERAITGEMIKEICVKMGLDRLGNII